MYDIMSTIVLDSFWADLCIHRGTLDIKRYQTTIKKCTKTLLASKYWKFTAEFDFDSLKLDHSVWKGLESKNWQK